ncbi:hypothetical protein SAMN05444274_11729 [Mariniphaga anaerophila]|uniref:Uncharacterized protein n=1 Tax=Mariniphaga anaerophila TaxID=1484053 RepID=A0A1M5G758_9BACT|nr:hypothetical protein [Mariniphaga anaerophila]SHF99301.1 hypothetical protein SAMN05444274_11729 [Mariniphaga anaerophila]
MKQKVNKKNYPEGDNFERKQKKHLGKKDRSSKRRLTIYDEFEDEDLVDYSTNFDEDEGDDF